MSDIRKRIFLSAFLFVFTSLSFALLVEGLGGGVVSSEPIDNILKAETIEKSLVANTSVTYTFTALELGIYEIAVTNKEKEDDVSFRVEVLKGTSKLVSSPAPGTVYRNVNIWSGTKNIKEAKIRFKVENTWFNNNGFKYDSDVKLSKWNGGKWVQLDTYLTYWNNGEAYMYFEAKTDSLGTQFVISGIKSADVTTPVEPPAPAPAATPSAPAAVGTSEPTEATPLSKSSSDAASSQGTECNWLSRLLNKCGANIQQPSSHNADCNWLSRLLGNCDTAEQAPAQPTTSTTSPEKPSPAPLPVPTSQPASSSQDAKCDWLGILLNLCKKSSSSDSGSSSTTGTGSSSGGSSGSSSGGSSASGDSTKCTGTGYRCDTAENCVKYGGGTVVKDKKCSASDAVCCKESGNSGGAATTSCPVDTAGYSCRSESSCKSDNVGGIVERTKTCPTAGAVDPPICCKTITSGSGSGSGSGASSKKECAKYDVITGAKTDGKENKRLAEVCIQKEGGAIKAAMIDDYVSFYKIKETSCDSQNNCVIGETTCPSGYETEKRAFNQVKFTADVVTFLKNNPNKDKPMLKASGYSYVYYCY